MGLTREQVREAVERVGDEHWQALIRHQEHAQRAAELFSTWQRHQEDTERLRDALRQLNEKIQEAQRKKNLLIAKQKRAQAQRRIHETMSGLSDSSAFEAFTEPP